MLFWRMHRAARIIFSLNVHLGAMTPDQAIDFLVERVGHERANATAEVRRSLIGTYPPLYQAAYMVGGLQFRALHQELVGSGRMTNREFHDRILQGGVMQVEMVRARLIGELLEGIFRLRGGSGGEPGMSRRIWCMERRGRGRDSGGFSQRTRRRRVREEGSRLR
jgi:hypothetical protein